MTDLLKNKEWEMPTNIVYVLSMKFFYIYINKETTFKFLNAPEFSKCLRIIELE